MALVLGVGAAKVFAPTVEDEAVAAQAWNFAWGGGAALGFLLLAAGFQRTVKGRYGVPLMMISPAMIFVALLVVFPFFFELRLAFASLNLYSIAGWLRGDSLSVVGFDNFINVFTSSPLQTATFWQLFGRTIIWTAINISFHVAFGLGLALLLNRPIRGKAIYRTLLIVPWAIPQVVAVLAWRGEFHPQFGMVNQVLALAGIAPVNWWSDPLPIFVSCCLVNIWLGIPFMMIVFLGGLQSIPKSLYEAAQIDGASIFKQFTEVTLPMLKPVVVPSVTLGTIWTFNNINVIYLMTGQDGGNESADILISALYKSAFTYSRYSYSAAFAMVIFAILMGLTVVWMRVSGGAGTAVAR
jgi:arabinogalactan oligomer/maltooligosaccharide transport system permease protein